MCSLNRSQINPVPVSWGTWDYCSGCARLGLLVLLSQPGLCLGVSHMLLLWREGYNHGGPEMCTRQLQHKHLPPPWALLVQLHYQSSSFLPQTHRVCRHTVRPPKGKRGTSPMGMRTTLWRGGGSAELCRISAKHRIRGCFTDNARRAPINWACFAQSLIFSARERCQIGSIINRRLLFILQSRYRRAKSVLTTSINPD